MMSETEYEVWTEFHRQLFQMKSNDDLPMFAAWSASLEEFTFGECRSASIAIASDISTAGRFRTEHLALIRQRIAATRFQLTKDEFAELNRQHNRYDCGLCSGNGLIIVPHVRSIINGVWAFPFYTQAIGCNCQKGLMWFNATNSVLREVAERKNRPAARVIDLPEYESLHPEWKELVSQRERQRKSESSARYHAEKADKSDPLAPKRIGQTVLAIVDQANGDAYEG